MRFLTDDGLFGFRVAPTAGRGLFRFQILIDDKLMGDEEPCILGSAMTRLRILHEMDDDRLDPARSSPGNLISILRSNEILHDAAVLSISESLDSWLLYGYVYNEKVTILGQMYLSNGAMGAATAAVVSRGEFESVVTIVRTYWSSCQE